MNIRVLIKSLRILVLNLCIFFLLHSSEQASVVVKGKQMTAAAAQAESQYKDHGWAQLDLINVKTPYSLLFYSEPRGLDTMLPDGGITRLRSLKTGFGNLYRVAKKADKVWRLYGDTRDTKDAATQFKVAKVGKYFALKSETAGGLYLESDPKTFDVKLTSSVITDRSLWELVEDPKVGDTLETCYLSNKATGGLLTASYDSGDAADMGSDESEMNDLKNKIEELEKKYPYIDIVEATVAGLFNGFKTAKSRNIKDKLKTYINGLQLRVEGNKWVEDMSGVSLSNVKKLTRLALAVGPVLILVASIFFPPLLLAFVACVVAESIALGAMQLKAKDIQNEVEKEAKEEEEEDRKAAAAQGKTVDTSNAEVVGADYEAEESESNDKKVSDKDNKSKDKSKDDKSKAEEEKPKEAPKRIPKGILHFGKCGRMVLIKYREGTSSKLRTFLYFESKSGNNDAPLEVNANPNRHPATPLKKRLEELQTKTAGMKKLVSSDIGRTGYGDKPFKMTQWSKVAVELVVDVPTDDDQGAPKDTIPGGSSRNLYIGAHRRPQFKGFSNATIDGFGPDMVVTVNPLRSKGFAWLEQSLTNPGKGTITFRAMSKGGDVHVCLSNDVAPQTVYRIAFGAAENTKTVIYKNEEVMQEINNAQSSNARITPGVIEQFWVSISNGFIMVGKGDAGTNIIMSWQDPNPAANIERVGFSTYKSEVKFANVEKLDDPIIVISPKVAYVSDSNSIKVGAGDSPAWHSLPLSPSDAGTVVFDTNGTSDASLYLANDNNEGYKITFGAEGNTATKILSLAEKNDPNQKSSGLKELYSIKTALLPLASLKSGSESRFWISYYKGLIIIGSGEIGKNTFCVFVDQKAPKGIKKIGFGGKSKIQNLEIWPEVELGFDQNTSDYTVTKNYAPFKGSLSIISPFEYQVIQEGPQVRFKDKLTGAQWNLASTPEPDSDYHFKIDVNADGTPDITLLFQDPSAEKIKIQASAKLLEAGSESAFRTGQTMAYGTGPEIISSMMALASAAAASATGAALKQGQVAQENKIAALEALSNRYVATEKVAAVVAGTGSVSDEAVKNRASIESKLETILQLSITEPKELEYATKQWADVLRLVTDSYAVSDTAVKRKITDGLLAIYRAIGALDLTNSTLSLFQTLMNTLIDAYNNPYLTVSGKQSDTAQRNNWYLWINDLATRLMSNTSLMQVGIDINCKGEYIWYPVKLPKPGSGSITFEARAYSNIFVGLSENPFKVRNVANRMYEIIIGMWDNKVTAIHRKSLGDSAVEFDHSKYPALSPDPVSYKKYWINIDNGTISMGVGELGQGKLVEWKDPYPAAPVTSVGFSNWLEQVSIRNVRVGYSIAKGGTTKVVTPAPSADSDSVTTTATTTTQASESTIASTDDSATEPAVDTTLTSDVDSTSVAGSADTAELTDADLGLTDADLGLTDADLGLTETDLGSSDSATVVADTITTPVPADVTSADAVGQP